VSAIRAAAAARKTTQVPPCYHREFAQATCAIFSYAEIGFRQGASKKSGASGEATPRGGPARKSRSYGERFCNHMEGHEKERNQAPNGLTPAERNAWDDMCARWSRAASIRRAASR
jgi:hypothetical protein